MHKLESNAAAEPQRPTPIVSTLIQDKAAWAVPDFAGPAAYTHVLTDEMLDDVGHAIRNARAAGLGLNEIAGQHFPLDSMRDLLAAIGRELKEGRGFVVLRGLPVFKYSKDEIGLLFWGMGTHLGRGLSQSVVGDRLGHVRDFSHEGPQIRNYRNNRDFSPHTDFADIVGLLCLRQAASGGVSRLTSALSIHNAILTERPGYLEKLYEGFHYHRKGEEGPSGAVVTPHRVPVFSCVDSKCSIRYVRHLIEHGMAARGTPINSVEREILDYLEAVSKRPELMLEILLEPGDCYFINNYTILHARTAFIDHEEEHLKRHLLRLWLEVSGLRPIHPRIHIYDGQGIAPVFGRARPTPVALGEAVPGAPGRNR